MNIQIFSVLLISVNVKIIVFLGFENCLSKTCVDIDSALLKKKSNTSRKYHEAELTH